MGLFRAVCVALQSYKKGSMPQLNSQTFLHSHSNFELYRQIHISTQTNNYHN